MPRLGCSKKKVKRNEKPIMRMLRQLFGVSPLKNREPTSDITLGTNAVFAHENVRFQIL